MIFLLTMPTVYLISTRSATPRTSDRSMDPEFGQRPIHLARQTPHTTVNNSLDTLSKPAQPMMAVSVALRVYLLASRSISNMHSYKPVRFPPAPYTLSSLPSGSPPAHTMTRPTDITRPHSAPGLVYGTRNRTKLESDVSPVGSASRLHVQAISSLKLLLPELQNPPSCASASSILANGPTILQ